ncbi:MAG: phosphoribosylformylglycinamidine synthase subunit PurQ [Alphaproteobacteria bacterium]|nr:phosphoribosylformylglycinamidine synthase subunit PurQ [Alphaproteobacteria bacterium]MBV8548655.1 phosphoribosylformylglycinamidine synthase subunit PurQ [Alphaproteobacteria bacterium]
MQTAIVVFPGSNRERDAALAVERATGKKPHIVWHADTDMPKVDLIMLPGGFSHGDYLRTGAMAAHSPIMREVAARAEKGVRVWGICNGFQILCEAGLLPGILLRNASLKFVCRPVTLKVENNKTDFTNLCTPEQTMRVIVAHGDGNYFVQPDTLKAIQDNGQVAFRYLDNPNGSIADIAGVFNKHKNVLGMMPHPEDAVEALHGSTEGKVLFDSVAKAFA